MVELQRTTKETNIRLTLDMNASRPSSLQTGLPFFNHMLGTMAFHGRFHLEIEADGDIDVDPHHLVEDTGLVIGDALERYRRGTGGIARYGQALIPMDDALSEAVVDVCGRPYLLYHVDWPQTHAGNFDLSLLREFWRGLVATSKINLHLDVRYAENSHHAVEALFKAVGRAIALAYQPIGDGEDAMSTKGLI